MSASDAFLNVRGIRLRYRDEGAGLAIVLLHGWSMDLEQWNAQASDLSAEFCVIRLDRRGFGLSDGIPRVREDVQDVQALCDHLHVRKATCLGMSQGARAAVRWTALEPARVRGLILDGPPGGLLTACRAVDDSVPLAELRRLLSRHGMQAVREQWSKHPLMQLVSEDARVQGRLDDMIRRYPGHDLQADTAADYVPCDVRSIKCPSLVIHGHDDMPARQAVAQELSNLLGLSPCTVIDKSVHLPNLDNPVDYNSVLARFLRTAV